MCACVPIKLYWPKEKEAWIEPTEYHFVSIYWYVLDKGQLNQICDKQNKSLIFMDTHGKSYKLKIYLLMENKLCAFLKKSLWSHIKFKLADTVLKELGYSIACN